MIIVKQVGNRLRTLRNSLSLSQAKLAELLGITQSSLNRYDSAHYKAALKKNGVRVVSAKENIADGPEGIILESMLEGMAEYYSAELSVKVIRGHTENALKCKYNGGTPAFGFAIDTDKHYQPDPITVPVVLDIFKMYDTGSTMKQIVDHLNDLGVTTVRGKPADLNFISGILIIESTLENISIGTLWC